MITEQVLIDHRMHRALNHDGTGCLSSSRETRPDETRCQPYLLAEQLAQAEAQRDRALEQLAAERSAHEQALVLLLDRNTELEAERSAHEQTRDELAQTEALLDDAHTRIAELLE